MSASAARRARGRRLAHLASRFFGSLRVRPLDDATRAWAVAALEPAEQRVWDGMGAVDQAEGVGVARRLETALAGTSDAAEPRWRAAALVHDAGKQLSGYSTPARALVTAVAAVVGDARMRAWVGARGVVRSRMGRYVMHDELGAELLEAAGARPVVSAWAAAHHRPSEWGSTGIPLAVCRALARADGEPEAG